MINTIKLDGVNSYFYDSTTEEIIERYDPDNKNLKLVLTLRDSSKLYVENESIAQIYGGQIIVQYNEDRFIIDDTYRDTLIKAGYIIYKNYDKENEYNRDTGIDIQKNIILSIKESINSILDKLNKDDNIDALYLYNSSDQILVKIDNHSAGYVYKLRINTVDEIVTKNLHRKDNSLSFYPFDKKMDKFGTVYVSVFAERKDIHCTKNKFLYSDNLIKDLILALGTDYHYTSLPIKNQILYYPEI